MRLLLDTHIALWAVAEPEKLSLQVREMIIDPENDVWVSVVTPWEMAIKHSVRKPTGNWPPLMVEEAVAAFRYVNFDILAISTAHCAQVASLPLHHRDPFDRMMVAQAQVEGLRLLTADSLLAAYGDCILLA